MSFGRGNPPKTNIALIQHMLDKEERTMKRSERAQMQYMRDGIKLPFNPENHAEVHIPRLHQPMSNKKLGDVQSVRIGFGLELANQVNDSSIRGVGNKPRWGKKKHPTESTEDCFVGGILVPSCANSARTSRQVSAIQTPNSLLYSNFPQPPHNTDALQMSSSGAGVAPNDSSWTGKKASNLAPLNNGVTGSSQRGIGLAAPEVNDDDEETGMQLERGPQTARLPGFHSSIPHPPPRHAGGGGGAPNIPPKRFTADSWGHGAGGYARKSLVPPPPREPNRVI